MTMLTDVARTLVARADDVGIPVCAKIRAGPARGLRISLRNASRNHLDGSYERPVQRVLEESLRPGDTFLDIGSSIGFFTLIAARLVGPEGRVFAVEPVPENARCILTSAAANGFSIITVIEAAAGGAEGSGDLALAHHPGGATLSATDAPSDMKGSLRVPVTTVDALLASGRIGAPSLVKIDVEGTEINVLEGMRRTLLTCRPQLVVEVDAATGGVAEAKFRAVTDWLQTAGYAVVRLEPAYPDLAWAVVHGVGTPA